MSIPVLLRREILLAIDPEDTGKVAWVVEDRGGFSVGFLSRAALHKELVAYARAKGSDELHHFAIRLLATPPPSRESIHCLVMCGGFASVRQLALSELRPTEEA